MLLTQLKCLYAKSGRRAGRMFISRTFPSGCKTTTISTEVTVHRSPHSRHASSPSSDFTRRPEIFGEQREGSDIFVTQIFSSLFRTHLLGCIMFIGAAIYFLIRPSWEVNWEEKMIFSAFFIGAILCLGFSFAFHTVSCHSEVIGKLFSK